MFCYQCQEAAGGTGCDKSGICGKTGPVSDLQDLLIYVIKGISLRMINASIAESDRAHIDDFIAESLFATITNANFDDAAILQRISRGLAIRDSIASTHAHDAANWTGTSRSDFERKAATVGIRSTADEDIRSLRELLTYGIKGTAAYAVHAARLGQRNPEIYSFITRGLAATLDDGIGADSLVGLVLECGRIGVSVMALLDNANTSTYGNPEITSVNIGVRNKPGILVSGHDLRDLQQLLEQTKGTGVDVYTHSEMLPAHYYPAFKKYDHLVGNYGNAWWKQKGEFEKFNGPVLFTTNCIVPPRDSYIDRVYTTGAAGFSGTKHIPDAAPGAAKDFSAIIAHAKRCAPPEEIETGSITGGFAHEAVFGVADKVVSAIKSGAIKRFFVMAGCDGRNKSRDYYAEFAKKLPADTVILTAGCAKYRYNKLPLGDIGGIPRVLDAGQCNDSYSLALIALKLKEVFNLADINELPISYNIAWYEQKAVIVLLALLYLGVKNIHLGPTLPAFLSPGVAKILVSTFGIGGISNVDADMAMFLKAS